MSKEPDINLLLEILRLKRPHRGLNEVHLAEQILARQLDGLEVFNSAEGLPMAYVITTDKDSETLFTAHLDTVHVTDGYNPVIYDKDMDWMSKEDGTPLGADDGAGVWLLCNMVEEGVPGTYLFTVGEERGGVGATWMADNQVQFLSRFKRAVAFDRKGTHSVITHQWGGRCCSDEFALALSKGLTTATQGCYEFRPDDGGVYTDTASFTDIIPECTNISAGYSKEHTAQETLDVGYLKALREAALTLDWGALPTARDPLMVNLVPDLWSAYATNTRTTGALALEDIFAMTKAEIRDICLCEPEAVAEMLIGVAYEYEAEDDDEFEYDDEYAVANKRTRWRM